MPNKFTLTGEPIEEIAPINFSQKPIHSCKFPPKIQKNPETYIFTRVNNDEKIGYEMLKIQTWETLAGTFYAQVEYESQGCHSRFVSKSNYSDKRIAESSAMRLSLITIIDYSSWSQRSDKHSLIPEMHELGWMGWLHKNCWNQVSRHSAKTIESGTKEYCAACNVAKFYKHRKPLTLYECIQKFPTLKTAILENPEIKDHKDFEPNNHALPGDFNRLLRSALKKILTASCHYGSGTIAAARFLAQRENILLSPPIEEKGEPFIYSMLEKWDFAHRRAFLEIMHSDFKFQ